MHWNGRLWFDSWLEQCLFLNQIRTNSVALRASCPTSTEVISPRDKTAGTWNRSLTPIWYRAVAELWRPVCVFMVSCLDTLTNLPVHSSLPHVCVAVYDHFARSPSFVKLKEKKKKKKKNATSGCLLLPDRQELNLHFKVVELFQVILERKFVRIFILYCESL
jgi:hypothetical protein